MWKEGRIEGLVNKAVNWAAARAAASYNDDNKKKARAFNSKVVGGKVREAVRSLTGRMGSGVLLPQDTDAKSGLPVIEVLQAKCPEISIPAVGRDDNLAFEDYPGGVPHTVPLLFNEQDVSAAAAKLRGSAGVDSVDGAMMSQWLTRYGNWSTELREEISMWAEWLAREQHVCWAAIRGLMTRRLVILDKTPGVRPVGIDNMWLRCISKVVVAESGYEAKMACGSTQLCAGLDAGIEGALHAAVRQANDLDAFCFEEGELDEDVWRAEEEREEDEKPLWRKESAQADGLLTQDAEEMGGIEESVKDSERWNTAGVTLVDANNGFNRLSRYTMLWHVRHRWAAASQFAFNCYRHTIRMVVRTGKQEAKVIQAGEGVIQGCVLGMLLYGVWTESSKSSTGTPSIVMMDAISPAGFLTTTTGSTCSIRL